VKPHLWRPSRGRPSTAFYVLVLGVVCAVLLVVWARQGPDPRSRTGAALGAELFSMEFTPEQGLGPLFNERACSSCHLEPRVGGVGRNGLKTVLRVGRLTATGFDPMVGRGGPFARAHSVSELGVRCDRTAGIPAGANVTSVRNTPPLFGLGVIDTIPDRVIRAGARAREGGVSGRPNVVRGPDGRHRIGRFGWKADTASLELFVAEALRNELGVTNRLAPGGAVPLAGDGACGELSSDDELGEDTVAALAAFVADLPQPRPRSVEPPGAAVFRETGCASCHRPSLPAGSGEVPLYSDLLLHDMGPALDDRVPQASARGRDWRTAPLWGLSDRKRFLHDGRADSIEAAILAHGGEAEEARRRFRSLSAEDRRRLIEFLNSL
jgi:CxxC motif-containing protein (DUF1111 family)